MALQNQDGVYLKIGTVYLSEGTILLNTYKDADVRANPTDFDVVKSEVVKLDFLHSTADEFVGTGNIRDDLIACAYVAMKKQAPYDNTTDEQWSDC